MKKILWSLFIIGMILFGAFIYVQYFFVFGRGVKTGTLNQIVYKGYFFKTYEGKLIQPGIRSNAPGLVASNEFKFSVVDKQLAEKLMRYDGQVLRLYYHEYKSGVPWRGVSHYVVDSMEIVRQNTPENETIIYP
jgi:hypothetical protein